MIFIGGSGLDRTDDFQKFCRQDWIRTKKFHSPPISASHLWFPFCEGETWDSPNVKPYWRDTSGECKTFHTSNELGFPGGSPFWRQNSETRSQITLASTKIFVWIFLGLFPG